MKVNTKLFIPLLKNKIPEKSIPNIIAGAAYYENMNGVPSNEYWINEEFDIRDEFFVILNSYFGLSSLHKRIPENNEWRLKFDVVFMYQLKSIAQSAYSLDLLTKRNCYPDAFAISRIMISRLNLLTLFTLNPDLYDDWLINPKDEKYLDGHIRKELLNVGISTVPHLYELTSEIVHSQHEALVNAGYFEKGLFPKIHALHNQIYVIAKYILGVTVHIVVSMYLQDLNGKVVPEELKNYDKLVDWFLDHYLVPNRIDHIFTLMPEDRHVQKVGKNRYKIGDSFDFVGIRDQISKFHRIGQPKKLSKKYNV